MCLPKDKKSGDKNNAFKHVLSNELKCAHYYQNFFKIETTFGNESNMIAKVENLSNTKIRNGSEMNCLIDLFLTLNTHYEVIYTLTDENFRNLSFESCSFENVERVKYLFDFYFPECGEKLITVPDINRIFDNILYHTNSEGRLGHLSEYATYYGEVKLFVELLLSKLENPAGILLKGFTQNHFASLLSSSSIEISAFEIDWLYLTDNVVMPIEVGLSDNPQKPVQAIVNKITQCLIKIIPQFQLIFYSYLTKFNQINEDESSRTFSEVIQNFLKIVVFLPNVSFFAFCVALKLIKDAVQNVVRKANPAISNGFSLLIQNYGFQLKDLTFIVLDDSSKNLRLIKIDKHLNVLDVHYSIHELFQPISEESCSFLGYLRALLSLASLTAVEDLTSGRREDTPIDVDERYRKFFSLWRKKHETDLSSRNFILSPQQHRLLAETQKTHLFITGQPGTGKTALLLAKCEQMALKEDVDSVFIVFNESDSILRRSIDAYIETQASEELRSKKEVIQRYEREIEHIRKSSKFTTEERTVVVIDELYDNRNIVDDFLNFKCCWVAAVEAGQMVGTAGSLLGSDPFWLAERGGKQVFEHENLNILFRSSHHISSVSNCFIERQLQTFPASVRIPGCFSSSENHTKIKYFIDWNDPALCDISFLSEAMTRRFLFIITDQSDIASRVEMLVSAWNPTDYFVIDDFEEGENYSFSGSDFFSVLAVIDLQDFKYEYLYDINMAVTRGQYELGFLLNSALRNNLDLMNYITKYKTSYAQAFEDFIEGRVLTSDWLIPTDLDRFQFIWWQRKIEESPSEDRKRYHELFKNQSPEICLQMAIAFPGENGFADSVDAVLQSAHNACSSGLPHKTCNL
ncbi:uncharacterized protein LOC134848914 isoform X2 [Symsagittifera roscoffensis]|uniref:uncharacterized protein LOC134848914 isoform X2 n=1 Tax=Symsagittifera roscoffensis TaxID=84072 RepID=UPI00307BEC91